MRALENAFWFLLATAFIAAVPLSLSLAMTKSEPACYDFKCSDNRPGCENDAGCLGQCYCDLDTYECVPE